MISNNTPNASCSSGTAEIQVYDNSLKRVCGCAEGSSGFFGAGQNLVCTIDAGTHVYFNFITIQNAHNIAVTGVGNTGTINPSTTQSTQTGVIFMNRSGTFTFQDFPWGTGGTFIVN